MSVEQGPQNGKTDAIRASEPVERKSTFETEYFSGFFDAITISGPAGTGKTTVANILRRTFDGKVRFYKAGQAIRRTHRLETGEEIVGAHDETVETDLEIDSRTIREIRRGKGAIIEGHMAGFFAMQQEDRVTERFFLTTENPDIAIARAVDRQNKIIETQNRTIERQNRKKKKRDQILPIPYLNHEGFKKQTLERQANNRARWQRENPELAGKDMYDPGSGLYTKVVKTDKMSAEEVAYYVLGYLIEKGHLVVKEETLKAYEESKKKDTQPSGEVFPANT